MKKFIKISYYTQLVILVLTIIGWLTFFAGFIQILLGIVQLITGIILLLKSSDLEVTIVKKIKRYWLLVVCSLTIFFVGVYLLSVQSQNYYEPIEQISWGMVISSLAFSLGIAVYFLLLQKTMLKGWGMLKDKAKLSLIDQTEELDSIKEL